MLSEQGVVNQSGLRFPNEFVRHKILDLMGDVALLGFPFIGHIVAERSGHALHTKLVEQILAQPDKWILLSGERSHHVSETRPSLGLLRPVPSLAV